MATQNKQAQTPDADPIQTLVQQVKMLDENIGSMLKSGSKVHDIIEDYICPILHAMAVAIEQSFAGLNNVAQTASVALITSEKTLAGETLTQVASSLTSADDMMVTFAEKLPPELLAEFNAIHDQVADALDTVLAWSDPNGESDEGDDEGDAEGEDGADDEEDDEGDASDEESSEDDNEADAEGDVTKPVKS